MHKQKVLETNNFAFCFAKSGGFMTFGGFKPDKHLPGEPIQSVAFTDNYKVPVVGLNVGRDHSGWSQKSLQEEDEP